MGKIRFGIVMMLMFISYNEIQAQGCVNIQDWCETISSSYCDTVPGMKEMCALKCDACPPPGCDRCKHNCTWNSNGTYKCSCYNGFRLQPDEVSCEDIDECEENKTICKNTPGRTFCENEEGSYSCSAVCSRFSAEGFTSYYKRTSECCKMTHGTCGQNTANGGRVVNGEDAMVGRWPWQALMILGSHLCGGTLINDVWAVSAAHCFASIFDVRKQKVQIRFGVQRIDDLQNNNIELRRIIKLVIHESYRFPANDIALVNWKRPVIFSYFVKPVCMPNGEIPTTGTKCYVTGFRVTVVGEGPARVVQQADVPIVGGAKCKDAYKEVHNINTTSMICAGRPEGGKDACQGDSGGPLVCQRCNNCDWYLAGVTSFGSGCGERDFYGVYTDVEYFEKWIETNAGNVKIKKRKCFPIAWTKWGPWGKCTQTCDGGMESKIRLCRRGKVGEPGCLGNEVNSRECNKKACGGTPKDSWTDWTKCSLTCGGGKQERRRICLTKLCVEDIEERNCNEESCPSWKGWMDWSQCDASCGKGSRTRTRTCKNGEPGDDGCRGPISQERECTNGPCTEWGTWDAWSECPVTCGGGTQTARRECEGGVAGMDCPGFASKSRVCGTAACPVLFGPWNGWSKCSVECGSGTQFRTRSCPRSKCEADEYGTTERQTRDCNEQACVGTWTSWSPWEACSETCGTGTQRRIRSCRGGMKCPGLKIEEKACNVQKCLGEWGEWSVWDICSKTCGSGVRRRTRKCPPDVRCIGSSQQERQCTVECLNWTDWSEWGDCTKSCGGGLRSRTRICRNGNIEAEGCLGQALETENCATDKCPVRCSDLCQEQVLWGYCVTGRAWMEKTCESDCCRGFCTDTSDDCVRSACFDERFSSCLRSCNYCGE